MTKGFVPDDDLPSNIRVVPEDDLPTAPEKKVGPSETKGSEVSLPEKIAGHPITRVLTGAADPFLGLAQLAAKTHNRALGLVGLPEFAPEKQIDDILRENMQMREAGRKDRGSEGFDWYNLAGNLFSPIPTKGAQAITKAPTLAAKVATGVPTGAAIAMSQPVVDNQQDFGLEKVKQALSGAAIGGLLPVAGSLVNAGGRMIRNATDVVTPGGAGRIADRWLKRIVGEQRRPEVVDALENVKTLVRNSPPTAADAVVNTSGGSPLLAAQRITAGFPGGVSADFADRITQQQLARRAVLEDLSRRGTAEQQRVARELRARLVNMVGEGKLRVTGQETPEKFIRAMIGEDRALRKVTGGKPLDEIFNKTQMKQLLGVTQELENQLKIRRPAQKTSLGGGINVPEETFIKPPPLLDRTATIANWLIKSATQRGVEPRVQRALADRMLNPSNIAKGANMAEALKELPPGKKEAILRAIINSGNAVAGLSTLAGRDEPEESY